MFPARAAIVIPKTSARTINSKLIKETFLILLSIAYGYIRTVSRMPSFTLIGSGLATLASQSSGFRNSEHESAALRW